MYPSISLVDMLGSLDISTLSISVINATLRHGRKLREKNVNFMFLHACTHLDMKSKEAQLKDEVTEGKK
jgi:hypothetical protein